LLTFTYDLVAEPLIRTDASPPTGTPPSQEADWLYDEIEMIPGDPPSWATSILLSNGWEV
jgi:hypothetical protein